jgi:hypothetical protein
MNQEAGDGKNWLRIVFVFGILVTVFVPYLHSNCTQHLSQLSDSKHSTKSFIYWLKREAAKCRKEIVGRENKRELLTTV